MSSIPDSDAQRAMGLRLRQIREALGMSQREMADVLGITPTGLSAWEGGRNQIDLVKLAKAARRYRFTTDWVALGDLSGVRRDLAERLETQMKSAIQTPKRGRPRRGTPMMLAEVPVEVP